MPCSRRGAGHQARLQLALLPAVLRPGAAAADPRKPLQGPASRAHAARGPPLLPASLDGGAESGAYRAASAFLERGLALEWGDPDIVLASAALLERLGAPETPELDPDPSRGWAGAAVAGGVRAALQQHWPLWLRAAAWHPHAAAGALCRLLPLLVSALLGQLIKAATYALKPTGHACMLRSRCPACALYGGGGC